MADEPRRYMDAASLEALWADIDQRVGDAVSSVYSFKGVVADHQSLPSGASAGDVYNVQSAYQDSPAGTSWAWDGTTWLALGGVMSLATQSAAGLMSASDKAKLDDLDSAMAELEARVEALEGN